MYKRNITIFYKAFTLNDIYARIKLYHIDLLKSKKRRKSALPLSTRTGSIA